MRLRRTRSALMRPALHFASPHKLFLTHPLDIAQAYVLCSVAVDFSITQAVNDTKKGHAMIPTASLNKLVRRPRGWIQGIDAERADPIFAARKCHLSKLLLVHGCTLNPIPPNREISSGGRSNENLVQAAQGVDLCSSNPLVRPFLLARSHHHRHLKLHRLENKQRRSDRGLAPGRRPISRNRNGSRDFVMRKVTLSPAVHGPVGDPLHADRFSGHYGG